MIYKALFFIEEQLNKYFESFKPEQHLVALPIVKLDNIGTLDEATIKKTNNVLITLVNLSEEFALKNITHFRKDADTATYANPPVFLNLFVLFTVCMNKYDHALVYLSHVIRFFQGKNTFDTKNSPTQIDGLDNFKITFDLYSPTFEQSNYLWSTLGGKQFPFVLYKIRLVELERESISETRGLIKEGRTNENADIN